MKMACNSIEVGIKDYFEEDEWNKLSDYEKTRYVNLKRNYEVLKSLGLNPNVPEFMLPEKKSNQIEDLEPTTKKAASKKRAPYYTEDVFVPRRNIPRRSCKNNTHRRNGDNSLTFNESSAEESHVERVKKKVPFNHIMRKVVFTLSGFVNPMRDELRRKALYMGATYKRDWDSTCTHLVSAFPNTPKYIQARSEDSRVVTKKWITDCYKTKICLPWRDYRLRSYDSGTSESDDSETDEEFDIRTKQKNTVQTNGTAMEISDSGSEVEDEFKTYMAIKNVDSGSGGDTEDEIRKVESKIKKEKLDESPPKEITFEAVNIKSEMPSIDDLPKVTDLFKQKQFFLYGNFSSSKKDLQNLITTYNGVVKGYLSGDIKYVITEAKWNSSFDEALCMNEDLIFVKPLWIYKCHESRKYVPYQPYIIIPDL